MWTIEKVIDILENHEIESSTLERQLLILGCKLDRDLDDIRHRVYPGAVRYDKERVQSSPTSNDSRMVDVVNACNERRAQHERDVETIISRLRDIRLVYTEIHFMDALDKSTLLNLYYPRITL